MPALPWKSLMVALGLLGAASAALGQSSGLPLSQLEPMPSAAGRSAFPGSSGPGSAGPSGDFRGGDMAGSLPGGISEGHYAGSYAGEIMPGGPPEGYFDLDSWLASNAGPTCPCDEWRWQVLPDGLIYKSPLASAKESRLSTQIFNVDGDGLLWDSTLGGRIGILRYGTDDSAWPQGWQWDLEGSGQVRLDPDEERDVRSVDFRAGTGATYGYGRHRMRLGYYHISSHLGDEFVLKNPSFERMNYVRDAIDLGYSYYCTDDLRLYSDVSWAFYGDHTGNWHFQFGVDYAPSRPTGLRGAPFFAINGHIREELDYSGNLVVQAGWAWRGDHSSHLLRSGLHYYNGMSNQYSFFRQFEQQVGGGIWYDY